MTKAHSYLETVRPDEVAETWDGVNRDIYNALWRVSNATPSLRERGVDIEDCGPHDVVGIGSVAEAWNHFSEEEREALNKLAVAKQAILDAFYSDIDELCR